MTTIRLRRSGGRNEPYFQVVVADSRRARNGRCLEQLGHYSPRGKQKAFAIDRERLEHWMKRGARLSRTVAELVARNPAPAAAAEAPAAQG